MALPVQVELFMPNDKGVFVWSLTSSPWTFSEILLCGSFFGPGLLGFKSENWRYLSSLKRVRIEATDLLLTFKFFAISELFIPFFISVSITHLITQCVSLFIWDIFVGVNFFSELPDSRIFEKYFSLIISSKILATTTQTFLIKYIFKSNNPDNLVNKYPKHVVSNTKFVI